MRAFVQRVVKNLFRRVAIVTKMKKGYYYVPIPAAEGRSESVKNLEKEETKVSNSGDVKSGICCRCRRKLKDPVSIERKFGTTCYKKYLLEHNGGNKLFQIKNN